MESFLKFSNLVLPLERKICKMKVDGTIIIIMNIDEDELNMYYIIHRVFYMKFM
jgi:hypothetical protein